MTPDRSDESRDLMDRLDRALPPHTHTVHADGDDPLVDAARRLAEAPHVALSDAAVRRIEARVQARLAETPSLGSSDLFSHRHTLLRVLRLAVAACLVIFVLGTVSAVHASASSLPGDTLYPVKRAIESGRLAVVATSDEANLRVELAIRRVDEFRRLLARGDVYPHALEESSNQLWTAARLLDAGAGDRDRLGPQIDGVAQQQAALAAQAFPAASVEEQAQLQTVTGDSTVLHELYGDGSPISVEPAATDEPAAIPLVSSPVPSLTPSATAPPTSTPTATMTPTVTMTATATVTATVTPTRRAITPTRRPLSDSIVPQPGATRLPTLVPHPGRFPTLTPTAPGAQAGNGQSAPGQQDGGPGNSENAPGQQDDGPGNSENAPGQQDDGTGNSENAPGQQDDGPGNSENAPGQTKTDKES